MNIFLQSYLLCSVRYLDVGYPVLVGSAPIGLATVAMSVPKKKGQQDLAGYPCPVPTNIIKYG